VLHVVTAILAVPLLLLVPLPFALGIAVAGIVVVAMTWAIERRRLPRELAGPFHDELAGVLAKTRRPHEDFPWSPVLYAVSLMIIALAHAYIGLSWSLAFAAYAILGMGDAASALFGVAYGRTRLPWNRRKSVEGTIAGFVAGYLAGLVLGAVPYVFGGLAIPPLFLTVAAGGAAAGALAETLPRVEDNFVVPLVAAGTMYALAGALGVPLP
jgi:dolichol kinase